MPVSLHWSGTTAVITLDRPDRRNALDMAMWRALRDAARNTENARAVVLTGQGPHFCSGMDLQPDNAGLISIMPAITEGQSGPAYDLLSELKECVQAVADIPVPTFAAIEGACAGGGMEIALACDVRIAASNAFLCLPETRIGFIPDVGGTARLTRLVGPGRAADIITTGRRVGGDEAYRLGLVERLCEPGQSLGVALTAAAEVALNGPEAVRLALNVIRLAPDMGLDEALSLETQAGVMAITSGEGREGVTAFLEKRKPNW